MADTPLDHPLEKRQALREAEEFLLFAITHLDSELVDDAITVYAAIADAPVSGERKKIQKRDDFFFTTKFYAYTDDEFLQYFRTSRYGFSFIAKQIENHPVFYNNSNCSQIHPAWQLAITLLRLGHYGSRTGSKLVAADVGVGGSSAVNYTNRVFCQCTDSL
ncbi:hypothetical protein BGZ82_001630 [Podila clonocystis]|nr:hypothetical protein BGZ82_001630 [Podila clonocystis]